MINRGERIGVEAEKKDAHRHEQHQKPGRLHHGMVVALFFLCL